MIINCIYQELYKKIIEFDRCANLYLFMYLYLQMNNIETLILTQTVNHLFNVYMELKTPKHGVPS